MAQHFATVDADGAATGFYIDEIHGAAIPPGAIPISEDMYLGWIRDTAGQRWDGAALVPYVRVLTLAELRAARVAAVKVEFGSRIAAGMPWASTRLQIDTDSRTNLLGAKGLADAGALPDPFAWRMADNSMLPLDAAGVQAMATAAGLYYAGLFAVKSALIDAIAAAPNAAAVEAIDVAAGWPA